MKMSTMGARLGNEAHYANFFVGSGNAQPLVDGNGAGLLKNVGITSRPTP